MEKISDFVQDAIQRIEIGNYEIRKLKDGTYWIEHSSGEGMQLYQPDKLELLIEQFYADNF